MRHKWNHPNFKNRSKDNSSVICDRCGMIRQYVGGIATYFKNDTVHDRYAPKCTGKNDAK